MKEQELKNQLKEIFQQITPEVLFDQLDTSRPLREQIDIDSFDFYRIIVQISERTGVKIPDSKLAEMKNLDQLITFICNHLGNESNMHC